MAGVTGSLVGSAQTAGGALSGSLVGLFYDHTERSLATAMAIASVLTLLLHRHGAPARRGGGSRFAPACGGGVRE
ncbi:MAG TPA: hypothetical protein VE871_03055 [Longimicrobium sp.]|nr:hypothetical protein [Longimicrobium sp.]